jgi:glutamate racemase
MNKLLQQIARFGVVGVIAFVIDYAVLLLLTEVVGKIMGPGVELINAGAESAWELKRTLTATDALAPERAGSYQLYASDITGDFATLAGRFLNEEVPPVEGVDIDLY